jgi:hypothetical protein
MRKVLGVILLTLDRSLFTNSFYQFSTTLHLVKPNFPLSYEPVNPYNVKVPFDSVAQRISPDDIRSAALADYLAKSHEDKLRAISEVERNKTLEINELKAEIHQLKALLSAQYGQPVNQLPKPPTEKIYQDVMDMPKEELAWKLIELRTYTSKYMMEAQEQKLRAIQATEEAAKKKWEESIKALMPAGTTEASSVAVANPFPSVAARNQRIADMSAIGKSRSGDTEVQRATSSIASSPPKPKVLPSTIATINGEAAPAATIKIHEAQASPVLIEVPVEVAAADHGLRADGSVGGWTLAERVALGSSVNLGAKIVDVASSDVLPKDSANTQYDKRNAKILEEAKAGKSRWGDMEIQRVAGTSGIRPDSAPSKPRVLRSTVVTINGEAAPAATMKIRDTTSAMSVSVSLSAQDSLYSKRNAKILEASKAGKSRWGEMEIQRVSGCISNNSKSSHAKPKVLPSTIVTINGLKNLPLTPITEVTSAVRPSSIPIPAEVAAADHGLRADGGVGGWTLAERVCLGASVNIGSNIVSPSPSVKEQSKQDDTLYAKRNARIQEAAQMEKSRWGAAEISRVASDSIPGKLIPTNTIASANPSAVLKTTAASITERPETIPVPPEVAAADHGLRSDGDVAGWSLAERVFLGAAVNVGHDQPPRTAEAVMSALYANRNAMVLAAAQAGKSRWGSQEISRLRGIENGHSVKIINGASAEESSKATPSQDRVNLGAKFLFTT